MFRECCFDCSLEMTGDVAREVFECEVCRSNCDASSNTVGEVLREVSVLDVGSA